MGLQNQILQTIVDSNKNNNKINTKMKFINIEMLKSEKDDVKINEEDVITIQVTNNNNNNNNISQKIEDNILPSEKAKIKEQVAQVDDIKVEEEEEKKERGEVSNKSLLEVVEAKAGCWNRQLFILNPDLEITSTIKQVKLQNSESEKLSKSPNESKLELTQFQPIDFWVRSFASVAGMAMTQNDVILLACVSAWQRWRRRKRKTVVMS